MDLPWLSELELVELTGYKRRKEQVQELVALGIPHRNGRNLIVSRGFLDNDSASDSKKRAHAGPDLSAVS